MQIYIDKLKAHDRLEFPKIILLVVEHSWTINSLTFTFHKFYQDQTSRSCQELNLEEGSYITCWNRDWI